MEQHDNDNSWVQDAENWICQIKDVRQCKIDLDNAGEVVGVHVVAAMDRDPKQIVRDVEGLLKARLDLDIFYKKIGVVQVVDGESSHLNQKAAPVPVSKPISSKPTQISKQPPAKPVARPAPAVISRLVCESVSVRSGRNLSAEVELKNGDESFTGICKGSNSTGNDLMLVASASVSALNKLLDGDMELALSEIREANVSGDKVLLVAIELISGRKIEKLYGTCAIQRNLHQAVVYSVLDAVNRKLSVISNMGTAG
ncbi:MAG: hypothetical protein GY752_02455 [bacterium]|nr:hypothetical protein [bacterium]MCP4799404.1 hypothetical protein [bacterium]